MLGMLVEEDLVDRAFLGARAVGLDKTLAAIRTVPVAACVERTGLDPDLVRRAARAIGRARALASFEDLGVQMNHDSTLVSYLHRLLALLTGNLGKPGTHFIPTVLTDIAGGASSRTSPVVGARIVGVWSPATSSPTRS